MLRDGDRTTSVSLTDDELVLLDGRCDEKVQATVEAAKARIATWRSLDGVPRHIAALVADVVSEARTQGRIVHWRASLRTCPVCQRNDGYWPHRRSSRYHRKGTPNFDAPKTISGFEFAKRFVVIKDHVTVGGCDACVVEALPHIVRLLDDVRAEVPSSITGRAPKWRWFKIVHCDACGWDGHEGQMGKMLTLMGDGHYRGECPQCHAKNTLGATTIKRVGDQWTVVAAEEVTP